MSTLEIDAAVEAARAQKHKFVFVPKDAGEELRGALIALAQETGREVLYAPPANSAELAARKLVASDRPVVQKGDDRAFLKNLRKIARGEVGVTGGDNDAG